MRCERHARMVTSDPEIAYGERVMLLGSYCATLCSSCVNEWHIYSLEACEALLSREAILQAEIRHSGFPYRGVEDACEYVSEQRRLLWHMGRRFVTLAEEPAP